MEYENWQKKFSRMKDSLVYMLDKGLYTDCSFIVGSRNKRMTVKAHKLILIQVSPVFEQIFQRQAMRRSEGIEEPDTDPEIFELFLRFLYSEEVGLNAVSQAIKVYYLASKYDVSWIKDLCIDYILKETNRGNAVQVFEFLMDNGLNDEVDHCRKLFVEYTSDYFESPAFVNMKKSTLLTILSEDVLNVESELEVYQAAVKWLEACNQRKEEDGNKKQILSKEVMSHVRFLSMSPYEFSGNVAESYLEPKEALAILTNITSNGNSPYPFPPYFSKKKRTFTSKKCMPNNFTLSPDLACTPNDCREMCVFSPEEAEESQLELAEYPGKKQLLLEQYYPREKNLTLKMSYPLEKSYPGINSPSLDQSFSTLKQSRIDAIRTSYTERQRLVEQPDSDDDDDDYGNFYSPEIPIVSYPFERRSETETVSSASPLALLKEDEADKLEDTGREVSSDMDDWNLILAINKNDVAALERLKRKGANLATKDSDGWSILHKAVEKGAIDVVKWILTNVPEIKIDCVTSRGNGYRPGGSTALHLASWDGNYELVKLLLAHGAKVNVVDHKGKTPLKRAIARRHYTVADLLKI